jgi:hypothetical protein
MATTVEVPKDADGNDRPVFGLFEHPEHGAQVWASTPADAVQMQAEGWKPVQSPKVEKVTKASEGVPGGK